MFTKQSQTENCFSPFQLYFYSHENIVTNQQPNLKMIVSEEVIVYEKDVIVNKNHFTVSNSP